MSASGDEMTGDERREEFRMRGRSDTPLELQSVIQKLRLNEDTSMLLSAKSGGSGLKTNCSGQNANVTDSTSGEEERDENEMMDVDGVEQQADVEDNGACAYSEEVSKAADGEVDGGDDDDGEDDDDEQDDADDDDGEGWEMGGTARNHQYDEYSQGGSDEDGYHPLSIDDVASGECLGKYEEQSTNQSASRSI